MGDLDIPTSIGAITPGWLTDALRSTNAIQNATVTSIEAEIVGEGAGFIGQLARLSLTYDRSEPEAPTSVIAKLPATAPENREIGDLFRLYEREGRFYKDLSTLVDPNTPRCFYNEMNIERGEFVLLLEDLAPAQVGDQLAGCSVAEVDLAVREIASLHAGWWDDPRLADLDWMPAMNDTVIVGTLMQAYQDTWDQFLERFKPLLTTSMLRTGERFGQHAEKVADRLAEPPQTFTHGDFRPDNMFFGSDGGEPVLTLIDWQVAWKGRGPFDVAYFLTNTLEPRDRKSNEVDILRRYHQDLLTRGVKDYSFDQCMLDYRLSTLFCLAYAVVAAGSVDLVNERAVALLNAIVERYFTAVEDLNSAELLP